jgi:hypothetical protein
LHEKVKSCKLHKELNSDAKMLRNKTYTDSGWEESSNENLKLKGEINKKLHKIK